VFPFWDIVIEPLIEAADPKVVVEIGALRGDTTVRLFESLDPGAELHVVDPEPQFDPEEHERHFGGRYVFHRDASLDVIPDLPPVDVALIDGDHNWYTVYNELCLLDSRARQTGGALPLLVLHDVLWPYGRRDGYYAPERIPPDFRQPCTRAGIERGRDALVPNGGLNSHIHNADHEGGARNGVLTALEDFVAEREPPVRHVVVKSYNGLAVAADGARLARCPRLGPLLDDLVSEAGQARIGRLAEQVVRETYRPTP
jgi:hypothetical protein